jgi:hypothetical protein
MTCCIRHLGDLLPVNPTGGNKRAEMEREA